MHIHAATFHRNTGYGKVAHDILVEVLKTGKSVTASSDNSLPLEFTKLAKHTTMADLLIGLPFSPVAAKAHFTMYESTELPEEHIENLKRRKLVIVPCEQNFAVFTKAKLPTALVPLGVNSKYYLPPNFNPFTFLHVSNDSGVPERKKTFEIIEAFKFAFPHEHDVKLIIKKSKDDKRIPCFDTRVSFIYEDSNDDTMANLYKNAHVGVFASGQEAWGYPHCELMAVGRPVIAPFYGGPKDFLDSTNAYHVNFKLTSVPKSHFNGIGKCALANFKHLAGQMHFCYANKEDTILKGVMSYRRMLGFSINRMATNLLRALYEEAGIQ